MALKFVVRFDNEHVDRFYKCFDEPCQRVEREISCYLYLKSRQGQYAAIMFPSLAPNVLTSGSTRLNNLGVMSEIGGEIYAPIPSTS